MAEYVKDIIVKIDGDGEVIFDEPGLNEWTTLIGQTEKDLSAQVAMLLPKIKAVKGFKKDGKEMGLDEFKENLSLRLGTAILNSWAEAIKAFFAGTSSGNA